MGLPTGCFYGAVVRAKEVAGVRLTQRRYSPGVRLPRHFHELPYFSLLLRGSYTEYCNARKSACQPGTALFHPAGEAHSDHFEGAEGVVFNVELLSYLADRIEELGARVNERAQFNSGPVVSFTFKLLKEFVEPHAASSLAIEGLVLEMLAEVCKLREYRLSSRPQRWVENVVDYLREHYSRPLRLVSVAAIVGVHPVHLARQFRKLKGCTVGAYVRHLRTSAAYRELLDSDCSITEIAHRTGFADHSHLARTLKSMTGMSATQLRAAGRNTSGALRHVPLLVNPRAGVWL